MIENLVLGSDSDPETMHNEREQTLRSNIDLERLIIDNIHEILQSEISDSRDEICQLKKILETTMNERNLRLYDLEDELQVLNKVGV